MPRGSKKGFLRFKWGWYNPLKIPLRPLKREGKSMGKNSIQDMGPEDLRKAVKRKYG